MTTTIYVLRINKFQFIEQKAPADLEKPAGIFYLFTAEQNKLTYL